MPHFEEIISEELYDEDFIIRPLRERDASLDFAAMLDRLEVQEWIDAGNAFTYENNLSNVKRHADAHERRQALTFTVVNPSESRVLGCVYLDRVGDVYFVDEAKPLDPDAVILRFWVRDSEIDNDRDMEIFEVLELWLRTWQLEQAVYFVVDDDDMRQQILAARYKLERTTSMISRNSGKVKHLYRFLPR
jgi:hypothetical protein